MGIHNYIMPMNTGYFTLGVPQDTGIPRDGMIWAETGTRIQIPKTRYTKTLTFATIHQQNDSLFEVISYFRSFLRENTKTN